MVFRFRCQVVFRMILEKGFSVSSLWFEFWELGHRLIGKIQTLRGQQLCFKF